jgi:NinG protein
MPKPRKCHNKCGNELPAGNTLRKACSVECALQLVKAVKAKAERKLLALRKAAIKPRQQWMREAQQAFNAYIRERDRDLPCISCGSFTPMTRGGDYDCGHYRSIGANPELRFHELNANKQCKQCNSHLSGNIVNYRIGLLLKYGAEVVAGIEGPHSPQKYSIDDLKEIKAKYKLALKELKSRPVIPL